ncbi:hypothetical protein CCR75_008129 [Bremia lactucae]|uniref:Uncharacterized protein n=1 Tax=Bremia lactucae TaxID=4779 RepID=A0A976FN28_BRELC|nr:hypothetical protein CCR75_008129 [Bremia lactucae]
MQSSLSNWLFLASPKAIGEVQTLASVLIRFFASEELSTVSSESIAHTGVITKQIRRDLKTRNQFARGYVVKFVYSRPGRVRCGVEGTLCVHLKAV